MLRRRRGRRQRTSFTVLTRRPGRARSHGFSRRVWAPALERAWPSVEENGEPITDKSKILRPRIHDLRHTCASWLIQAGVPMPVVSQHLGHESINTTISLYVHLDRSSMKSAADAIASALETEPESLGAEAMAEL